MRELLRIALLALIAVFLGGNMMAASALELQKTRSGYTAVVIIPDVTINVTENGYAGLAVKGYYYNNPVGMPALPERMFRLAIGKNKTVPEIGVTVLEEETIALPARLHPIQEDYPDHTPVSSRTFHIDRDFYTTTGTKEPLVSVSELFVCHGVPGVEVSIRPVSYNPLQNRVTVAKKFRLDITMPEGLSAIPAITSKSSHAFVKKIFTNYDVPLKTSNRKEGYLIICESDYEGNAALDSFITFREQLYDVTCVKLSDVGSSSSAIQSYIREQSPTPTYVLFVGNPSDIPHFSSGAHSYWQYSLEEGSDKYSDIFVGMFAVRSASGLGNIVHKTIYTEKNIDNYPKQVTLYSTYDGDGHIHREVTYMKETYWEPGNWEIDWQIADNNSSLSASQATSNTEKAIAENASKIVIYQGHGGTSGFTPGINSSDVRNMTNTEVYPFVWGFACQTGSFSGSSCFGEAWITEEHGACMYTGASVNSSTYQKVLNAGMARAASLESDLTTIGQIFYYGKHFVWDTTINVSGFNSSNKTSGSQMYNLFGDPALETEEYASPIINESQFIGSKKLWLDYVIPNAISLRVPEAGKYSLMAYSADGQKIHTVLADKQLQAGKQTLQWKGSALPAGVYFMRLKGENALFVNKFVLME
jgi:hypothetical protein